MELRAINSKIKIDSLVKYLQVKKLDLEIDVKIGNNLDSITTLELHGFVMLSFVIKKLPNLREVIADIFHLELEENNYTVKKIITSVKRYDSVESFGVLKEFTNLKNLTLFAGDKSKLIEILQYIQTFYKGKIIVKNLGLDLTKIEFE